MKSEPVLKELAKLIDAIKHMDIKDPDIYKWFYPEPLGGHSDEVALEEESVNRCDTQH